MQKLDADDLFLRDHHPCNRVSNHHTRSDGIMYPGMYAYKYRKRQQEDESRTAGKQDAGSSKSKRQKTKSPAKKKKGTSASMYLVRAEEYGDYRDNEQHTIGFYTTKELALENARVAFEEQFSNGFFQHGKFTEPQIFDIAEDNSKTIGDEGTIYHQCDQEGDGVEITLESIVVDEPYRPK